MRCRKPLRRKIGHVGGDTEATQSHDRVSAGAPSPAAAKPFQPGRAGMSQDHCRGLTLLMAYAQPMAS